MKDFDKLVIEKRIRQSNISWLVKEILIGVVGGFLLYIFFFSK